MLPVHGGHKIVQNPKRAKTDLQEKGRGRSLHHPLGI